MTVNSSFDGTAVAAIDLRLSIHALVTRSSLVVCGVHLLGSGADYTLHTFAHHGSGQEAR